MKRTVIPAVILLLALAAGIFFLSGGSLGTSVVGIKTFLGIQSPGGSASDAAGSAGRLFDNGDRSAGDVRILFATPDGIQVTSPNPVTAAAGSQVSFEISVEDGYVIEALPEGWTLDGTRVFLSEANYSSTAVPKVRKLDVYDVTVITSDGGDGAGAEAGVASSSSSECTEGGSVILSAAAGDHFAFAGWSLGTPAFEGGRIFSEDAETELFPESDAEIYANFRRVSCPVTIEESEGIDFITPREVTVLRGGICFFMFTLQEDDS